MDLVAAIIKLKLKLMFRQSRGALQVVSIIVLILFFVIPVAIGGGVFSSMGFGHLVGGPRREFLYLALTGAWLFWLVFPIVGFSLNQSYDLTKLFIFPVSRTTIFSANVLGCFTDPTMVILLPAFLAVAYHHTTSAAAGVLVVLALALFVVQTVALSQAFLWALVNMLRSRRMRDWAMLLGPLIAVAIYMMPQVMMRRMQGPQFFDSFLSWQPSRYVFFLPPGMAAGAIGAAERGSWLAAVGYLAGLAGYVGASIALGVWVLGKLHAGELGTGLTKKKRAGDASKEPLLQRLATTPLTAMAAKELRYFWREPRHKLLFLAPVFPLIFIIAGTLTGPGIRHPFSDPIAAVAFTASMCLMNFSQLFQNVFGIDREGLRLLFTSPCNREEVLIGKNVAGILVAVLTTSAATIVAGFITHAPHIAVLSLPIIVAGAIIFAALGNLVSIYFPMRVARRTENPFTSSSGRGCMVGLISLGSFFVTSVVVLPIVAAAVLPGLWGAHWAYLLTVPGSLAYALGIYVLLLKKVARPALMAREPTILEECLTSEPT